MTREFSVYRYNSVNRPKVLGKRPFLVEGPSLRRMIGSVERELRRFFGEGTMDDREVVAEFLLEARMVDALWAISQRGCLSPEQRRPVEIAAVTAELRVVPWRSSTWEGKEIYWDLGRATWEYLDGIPTAAMRRSFVTEDGIVLG